MLVKDMNTLKSKILECNNLKDLENTMTSISDKNLPLLNLLWAVYLKTKELTRQK